jgi:Tol biopolymer transport system component
MNGYNKYALHIILSISLIPILVTCSATGIESTTMTTGIIMDQPDTKEIILPTYSNMPLVTLSEENTPMTSPASSRIYKLLYQKGASILEMAVDPYGTADEPKIIATTEGTVGSFDISPDGKSIVMSIGLGPGYDRDLLQIIDYDTQSATDFGDNNTHVATPKWSPSGEYIAYIYHNRGTTSIKIDPTEKCNEECFPKTVEYYQNEDYGMMYSPTWIDDEHIGYLSGIHNDTELCIGDSKSLTHSCPIRNMEILEMAVSPNRDYILLTITGDNTTNIFIFNYKKYIETEEIELLQVTSAKYKSRSPIWAVDNRHFLFRKQENKEKKLIFAEIDYATMKIAERILIINNDLGLEYAITEDGGMLAWTSEEFEETPYSSIYLYPINITHPFEKVNRIMNMTLVVPKWLPIE